MIHASGYLTIYFYSLTTGLKPVAAVLIKINELETGLKMALMLLCYFIILIILRIKKKTITFRSLRDHGQASFKSTRQQPYRLSALFACSRRLCSGQLHVYSLA